MKHKKTKKSRIWTHHPDLNTYQTKELENGTRAPDGWMNLSDFANTYVAANVADKTKRKEIAGFLKRELSSAHINGVCEALRWTPYGGRGIVLMNPAHARAAADYALEYKRRKESPVRPSVSPGSPSGASSETLTAILSAITENSRLLTILKGIGEEMIVIWKGGTK